MPDTSVGAVGTGVRVGADVGVGVFGRAVVKVLGGWIVAVGGSAVGVSVGLVIGEGGSVAAGSSVG